MRHLKFILAFWLSFLVAQVPQLAVAVVTDADRAENTVNAWAKVNPGFESGKANWTALGGTFAIVTNAAGEYEGKQSATWDASSAGQELNSPIVAFYRNGTCEVSILIGVPSGTATHKLQIYNGTTNVIEQNLISSATPIPQILTFPCQASPATLQLRVVSVASNEPLIRVDGLKGRDSTLVGSSDLITEWVSYTPTLANLGSGSTASNTARWRRVGDSMQIYFSAKKDGSTGSGGTQVTVTVPSGFTIDTTKLPNAVSSGGSVVGSYHSAATAQAGTTVYNTSTTFAFYDNSGFFTGADWDAGEILTASLILPISGWTSSTVINNNQQRTPTVQVLTSGSTYTTPAGVTYLEVELVGAGGGGGGSGTSAGSAAGSGGTTSFGTSLLSATGGGAGAQQSQPLGGTASVSAPAIAIVTANGNSTGSGWYVRTGSNDPGGGNGGASPFGGAGAGGSPQGATAGSSAIANSGSGGGGGGGVNVIAFYTGSGGGSGGYLKAIIPAPASSYAYSIGTGGTAGGAGSSGAAGGTGGSGRIIVREFYGYTTALIANSVSTTREAGERIESFRVDTSCTGSPCTIASQSGGFTAITRAAQGIYDVTYPATIWPSGPRCVISAGSANSLANCKMNSTPSSTGFQIFCPNTATGAGLDSNFYGICMGAR